MLLDVIASCFEAAALAREAMKSEQPDPPQEPISNDALMAALRLARWRWYVESVMAQDAAMVGCGLEPSENNGDTMQDTMLQNDGDVTMHHTMLTCRTPPLRPPPELPGLGHADGWSDGDEEFRAAAQAAPQPRRPQAAATTASQADGCTTTTTLPPPQAAGRSTGRAAGRMRGTGRAAASSASQADGSLNDDYLSLADLAELVFGDEQFQFNEEDFHDEQDMDLRRQATGDRTMDLERGDRLQALADMDFYDTVPVVLDRDEADEYDAADEDDLRNKILYTTAAIQNGCFT